MPLFDYRNQSKVIIRLSVTRLNQPEFSSNDIKLLSQTTFWGVFFGNCSFYEALTSRVLHGETGGIAWITKKMLNIPHSSAKSKRWLPFYASSLKVRFNHCIVKIVMWGDVLAQYACEHTEMCCFPPLLPSTGSTITPNYLDNSTSNVGPWCSCAASGNHREQCSDFLTFFHDNICLSK